MGFLHLVYISSSLIVLTQFAAFYQGFLTYWYCDYFITLSYGTARTFCSGSLKKCLWFGFGFS